MHVFVATPYTFCEKCRFFEIEETLFRTKRGEEYKYLACKDYKKCEQIICLYEQERLNNDTEDNA